MNIPATIGFENLTIRCIIGELPEERVNEQEIYVDLKVEANIFGAATADSFANCIDYVALADLCTRLAQERKFQLLEAFVYEAAELLLQRFDINTVWIRCKKPLALSSAQFAYVELKREKKNR